MGLFLLPYTEKQWKSALPPGAVMNRSGARSTIEKCYQSLRWWKLPIAMQTYFEITLGIGRLEVSKMLPLITLQNKHQLDSLQYRGIFRPVANIFCCYSQT